ncbi:MAG: hypothetical protein ABR567_19565 [Myxococcales bacterium]|nr:hypothetical protein [Myxococcales bacterium]
MRVILAAFLCALPLHAAGLDVEIAPGLFWWSNDVASAGPVLRARVGYETSWLTPSLTGIWAFLDPGEPSHQGQKGGIAGWGLAAELRVHTSGAHRVFAALGAGLGELSTLQVENGDTEAYHGATAPYVEGAAGYQFVGEKMRFGIELTLDVFNRVHRVGDLGTTFCVDEGGANPPAQIQFCPTGRSFPVVGVAVTLGFDLDGT